MSRALITIRSKADRDRACHWIEQAPWGTRVELKATKRSIDQNSLMWSRLTDIATQLRWHGQKLRPDDFKLILLDGLKRELRVVPNMEGNGFVNLGRSSSDLTKDEMSQFLELIGQFAAQHGVIFNEPGTDNAKEDQDSESREADNPPGRSLASA